VDATLTSQPDIPAEATPAWFPPPDQWAARTPAAVLARQIAAGDWDAALRAHTDAACALLLPSPLP
jgi:hypothetical protein